MLLHKQLLDLFGEILIHQVRDESIDDWEMMLDGRMKGELAEQVRSRIARFDQKAIHTLKELLPKIVDTVLHHSLWTIEQDERLDVRMTDATGTINIREASDGLAGELYGENGWIAHFSNKPRE
jgi:hypothetical protein